MRLRNTLAGLVLASLALAAQDTTQDRGKGRFRPDMGAPGGARFLGARAGTPGRVVKNAPYSAEVVTEVTQALPDGNRIHQVGMSRVYRDSEGRTRTEQSLAGLGAIAPNSHLPTVIFLQDPVAGTSYALDATRKRATKSAWLRGPGPSANPMAGGRRGARAGDQNTKTESLGKQTMDGVPVDGTRTTTVIPAGQLGNERAIQTVTERWYSPDLQVYVMTRHTDPRSGETITRMTNLTRSEPAHALFEVPAEFVVVEDNYFVRPANPPDAK